MGFKDVRMRVIEALRSELYQNEPRADINEKNLLYTEAVSPEFVIHLLRRCSGYQYETSSHHWIPDLICHVFTPDLWGVQWYVKVYLLAESVVFISVHPS